MIIGHYAAAFAVKPLAPKTSLGVLIAAAAFLDLLWPVLLLLGLEEVVIAPGNTAFSPLDFTSYPWSHSLLAGIAWGALCGGLYYAWTRYRAGALAVALLVPGHWVLDWIVHRPDLPLVPGGARYGLGLWNSIPYTLGLELAMFGVGVFLYCETTKARDRIGAWGTAGFVALTMMLYGGAVFGPPPPSVDAIAWTDMGQWLFILIAAWFDAHRTPRKTQAHAS